MLHNVELPDDYGEIGKDVEGSGRDLFEVPSWTA
jgi:hypothetical protein